VLDDFNNWLLRAREMKDSYRPVESSELQLSGTVRLFLLQVKEVVTSDDYSSMPLDLAQGITSRFIYQQHGINSLDRLLQAHPLTLADITD